MDLRIETARSNPHPPEGKRRTSKRERERGVEQPKLWYDSKKAFLFFTKPWQIPKLDVFFQTVTIPPPNPFTSTCGCTSSKVEPAPTTFRYLLWNLRANDVLAQVWPLNLAVSTARRSVRMSHLSSGHVWTGQVPANAWLGGQVMEQRWRFNMYIVILCPNIESKNEESLL